VSGWRFLGNKYSGRTGILILDARENATRKATMKAIGISLCLSAVLFAGCEGTGPNTQRGAVLGGALGALAGGIIGNNSGGRTWQGAAIGGAAGALAGGTLGNAADHENGSVYGQEKPQVAQAAPAPVVVQTAPATPPPPPPPQTVVVVPAAPRTVWVDTYRAWSPRGEVIVMGHWETPPPGCSYFVPPHWEHRHGRRIYVGGYWN
jgi:outer membrane lipoprotein SlyB